MFIDCVYLGVGWICVSLIGCTGYSFGFRCGCFGGLVFVSLWVGLIIWLPCACLIANVLLRFVCWLCWVGLLGCLDLGCVCCIIVAFDGWLLLCYYV